jgi:hypothetical protein
MISPTWAEGTIEPTENPNATAVMEWMTKTRTKKKKRDALANKHRVQTNVSIANNLRK